MGKLNVFSRFTRKLIGRDLKSNPIQIVPSASHPGEDRAPTGLKKFQSHQNLLVSFQEMSLINDVSEYSVASADDDYKKAAKSFPGYDCGSEVGWLDSISRVHPESESHEIPSQLFEKIGLDRDSSSLNSDPADVQNCSRNMSFKDLPDIDGLSIPDDGRCSNVRDEGVTLSLPRVQSECENIHVSMECESGADILCHLSDPGAYGHRSFKSQSGLSWQSNSAENNASPYEFIAENASLDKRIPSMDDISADSGKEDVEIEDGQPFTFSSLPISPEDMSALSFMDGEKPTAEMHETCEEFGDHYSDDSEYSLNKLTHILQNEDTVPPPIRDEDPQDTSHYPALCTEMEETEFNLGDVEAFGSALEKESSIPLQKFHVLDKFMRKDTRIRVEQWIMESVIESAVEYEDMDLEDTEHRMQPVGPSLSAAQRSFSENHLPSLQASALSTKAHVTNALLDGDVEAANRVARSLERNAVVVNISSKGLKLIPGLSSFQFLRSISLSHNSIARINSGALPRCLHMLDLSHNRLTCIEGLRELGRLRILNLSHNRISRIGHGLSGCTALKELYLSGNKISEVEGLHRLLKLCILDLSLNKITSTKALSLLAANYGSMQALNLTGNPIHVNLGADAFKRLITSLLPHLLYLNKQPVKAVSARDLATDNIARAATGTSHRVSKTSKSKTSSSHRTSSNPRSSRPVPTSGHAKTRKGKEDKDDKRHGAKAAKTDSRSSRHRHHHHHHHHHHHDPGHGVDPLYHEGRLPKVEAHFSESCREVEGFNASEMNLNAACFPLTSN